VRILRRLLLSAIGAILLAVLGNYLISWNRRERQVEPAAELLGGNTIRADRDIEYTARRSGEVQFKIRAEELRETRDGRSVLRGIEGNDFNADGTVRNRIRSREAEYDRKSERALFTGNVFIQLGDTLQLRTDSMRYEISPRIGYTDDTVRLQAPEISGTARGFRYDSRSGNLELKQDVRFTINHVEVDPSGSARQESYAISAASGRYWGDRKTFRFEGPARLVGSRGTLSGNIIEAQLSEDQRRLVALVCEGDALYQTGRAQEEQSLRGQKITFRIEDRGLLGAIYVEGMAHLSQSAAGTTQDLRGDQIDFTMDPVSGLPDRVEGRGGVRFRLKSGAAETLLSGETLDSRFAPGETRPEQVVLRNNAAASTLNESGGVEQSLQAMEIRLAFQESGDSVVMKEMQAAAAVRWDFRSAAAPGAHESRRRALESESLRLSYAAAGGQLRSAVAARNVRLTESETAGSRAGEERRLSCDRAEFNFTEDGKSLRTLQCTGAVEIHSTASAVDAPNAAGGAAFRTYSRELLARFDEADGSLRSAAQWGEFRYQDAMRRAAAERCDYDASAERVTLSGSPQVWDESGHTQAGRMEYSGEVLRASGGIRTELAAGSAGPSDILGNFGRSSSPGIITARTVEAQPAMSLIRYQGEVLLLAERLQLQCDTMRIHDHGARILASGAVSHVAFKIGHADAGGGKTTAIRGRSSELEFTRADGTLRYSGGVHLESGGIEMDASRAVVLVSPATGEIDRAEAAGQVHIAQGGRMARGDIAEYLSGPGKIIVTGAPAVIMDPGGGSSTAPQLTFNTTDDRILLGKP